MRQILLVEYPSVLAAEGEGSSYPSCQWGQASKTNFKKRMRLPRKLALFLALQQLAQHMYLCHPNHDAAAMTLTTLEVSTKSRIHDFLSKG